MARTASLSDVEDGSDDEVEDLVLRPATLVAVEEVEEEEEEEEEELQRMKSLDEEVLRMVLVEEVEETKLKRCFNGCEDTLNTFNASIFPSY